MGGGMSIFEYSPRKWPMTHLKNTQKYSCPPPPLYRTGASRVSMEVINFNSILLQKYHRLFTLKTRNYKVKYKNYAFLNFKLL